MPAFPVTDATWNRDVLGATVPVIVEITASWCTPGDITRRAVDHLASDAGDHVRIVRLDLDANPLTVRRYAITSIPTILVIEGGRVTRRLLGARNLDRLCEDIGDYLAGPPRPPAVTDGSV
jgi:thioredoxin 1